LGGGGVLELLLELGSPFWRSEVEVY
jgi:hypothetical protein